MSGDFKEFVKTAESIKSTSSKLEKVGTLSQYFKSLSKSNLEIAARFFAARIFAPVLAIEANVGYSTLTDLILEITGAKEHRFRESYLRHGDLGEIAGELMSERTVFPLYPQEVTLSDVYSTFESAARTTGSGSATRRRDLIRGLLLQCSPQEAKYVIKLLTRELRIGLVEGLVEEAVAKTFGITLENVREVNLVIADIGMTAVLAAEQRLGEAQVRLMHPTNFMLADTMQTPEEISGYYAKEIFSEFKYDGVRAQVHKSDQEVKIFSRRLDDVSASFPELLDSFRKLESDLILDGEILPYKDGRPLPFQLLQQRLRRKEIQRRLLEEIPLKFFAYDILYHRGVSLFSRPLTERRSILESLSLGRENVMISAVKIVRFAEEIRSMFEESKNLGFEGLVVKDPSSPYRPGRRGKHWVKLKTELDTLDVVVVAAEYGHGKRAGVISDYTFAVRDDTKLKVVGKAYSGLTDEEILQMTDWLKGLTVRDLGFRRLVKPEIVLEVAFDNIQRSDRHDSGFALRFPRIKRIRYDKRPEEIDTIDKVREIYERQRLKVQFHTLK